MTKRDPLRDAADRPDPAPDGVACAPFRGMAVLVVDDIDAMRHAIAGIFQRAGARVRAFDDPREALAAIEGDPEGWGLLVTDHDMPQMTGSELACAARAAAPALPVLLCTALPDWHGGRHCSAPCFDALVGKPASPEALLSGARAALDRRAGAGDRAAP